MPEGRGRKRSSKRQQGGKKSGLYTNILDDAEKLDFELAAGVDGIDDEIALLRVEIKKAMAGGDARNLKLLIDATNALERLIRTRYQITKEQRKGLREAISTVLKDIAIPLGINIGAVGIARHVG